MNRENVEEHRLSDYIQEDVERTTPLAQRLGMLLVACVMGLLANWMATDVSPLEALPGMAILFGISVVGFLLAHHVPLKFPAVAWVSLLAVLLTVPGVPGAALVTETVAKLNFLALATPALAYAGLALSTREFETARRSGWKILIVAICVMLGTYLGSVIISDVVLRITG